MSTTMFAWDKRFSVGHPGIDQQHQELFRIADRLYAAMVKGVGRHQVAKTLAELITYTKSHFGYEEQLMGRSGYPQYASHKAEHDALTAKVVRFQAEVEAGSGTVTLDVMVFLKEWLAQHIAQRDSAVGKHLAARTAA